MHSRFVPLACACALALSACQQGAVPSPSALHLSPPATRAAPGEQVRFTVASPPGVTASDVAWSVDPAGCGSVDAGGLYTAPVSIAAGTGMCTVVATLRSDPSRVGLGVVMVEVTPPVDRVVASGQVQAADGVVVESVAQEPISTVTSRDASGSVESRGGFYPSGNVSP